MVMINATLLPKSPFYKGGIKGGLENDIMLSFVTGAIVCDALW